jgi:hypothetical protein
MAYSFEGLAQVAAAEEKQEGAAILWGAAAHLREMMNIPLDPSREELYTSLIPASREQIGQTRFEELWKKGKTMKLEEVIAFALSGTTPGPVGG